MTRGREEETTRGNSDVEILRALAKETPVKASREFADRGLEEGGSPRQGRAS